MEKKSKKKKKNSSYKWIKDRLLRKLFNLLIFKELIKIMSKGIPWFEEIVNSSSITIQY